MSNAEKMIAAFLVFGLTFIIYFVFLEFNKNLLETTKTNNQDYEVSKLFTKDGCDVYRFRDAGYSRYFVKCENAQAGVSWSESCGKGCTNNVSVQTSNSDK